MNSDYVSVKEVTDRADLGPHDLISIGSQGWYQREQFVCLTNDTVLNKELGYTWTLWVRKDDPRAPKQES